MFAVRPARTFTYAGRIVLPKKLYQGNSDIISLELYRSSRERLRRAAPSTEGEGSDQFLLQVPGAENRDQYLEVTLVAMAVATDDTRKSQKRPLTSKPLEYQWVCSFNQLGKHKLALEINLLDPSGKSVFLQTTSHSFTVVKFGSLTQRALGVGSAILSVSGFIGAVTGAIFAIIQFIHVAGWH